MSLKLKDPSSLTYPSKAMRWEGEKEDMENGSDEAMDSSVNVVKKKRRPANLSIECPVCGGPAPDHLHFGGQSCYSCRAFFRRTSPRPISSFRCRSGLNNCIINSGSKSCIPCRLTKCIQIGMDPALVRGKKYKSDSDNEDSANHYDDQYNQGLATIPPPTLISKSSEDYQESLLKFRADVLNYQGLCLQYQASILEKQARSMGDNKEDNMEYNNKFVEPTDFHHIKSEPKYESEYVPAYEAKYSPPVVKYGVNKCLNKDIDGRDTQYDLGRYLREDSSPISTGYEYMWMRDNEYAPRESEYTQWDNECMPRDNECNTKDNWYTPRNNDYTTRDRSPVRRESYRNTDTYSAPQDSMCSNIPSSAPSTLLNESHIRKEADCQSSGPLDLTMKKSTPSPQLHTQVHNMPRIFFRTK